MPISAPCNKKPIIAYLNRRIRADRLTRLEILDLGIGKGDFGKLIKETLAIPTRITGVEVWDKYRNAQWDYYDEVIIEDVRTFVQRNSKVFDIILLIDVLEHFVRAEGRDLLNRLTHQAAKAVLLSTPITRYPQGSVKGNPHETHRCTWQDDELRKMGFKGLFYRWIPTFALWPIVARLGVYVAETPVASECLCCEQSGPRASAWSLPQDPCGTGF